MRGLFLSVILLLLLAGTAPADPYQIVEKARQECFTQLPGTYDVEGYDGVQHLPRMKPSYRGSLTITAEGDRFRVKMQWPQGSAEGIGMLTPGPLTEGRPRFYLLISSRSHEGKLAVTSYTVQPPMGQETWELYGPWMGEKDKGYEQARKR